MASKRIGRISEEMKKVISNLIRNQIKDPRISMLTSVTDVNVTKDLRYAKIYISVLGTDKEKEDTLKGLQSAKGFVRKEIGNNINLRYTPEPMFYLDNSIDNGMYISNLLKEVSDGHENKGNDNDNE